MHCKHCGNKIDEDSRFCSFCGGQVVPIGKTIPTDLPSLNSDEVAYKTSQKAERKIISSDDMLARDNFNQNQCSISLSQYNYAGFWLRFCAYWIDFVILFIIGSIFLAIIDYPVPYDAEGPFYLFGFAFMLVNNPISLIIRWLYFAMMESSSNQGTIGKMVMKLRVTDGNGQRVSLAKATRRHFGKLISGLLLGTGYFITLFTPRKQSLHDIMADCLVLRIKFPSTNF
jgi:uncharacterized RDD family membrane protein YckC